MKLMTDEHTDTLDRLMQTMQCRYEAFVFILTMLAAHVRLCVSSRRHQ